MSFASTVPGSDGAARSPRWPRSVLEIVGILFLFIHFWPLAIGYLIWKAMGHPMPAEMRAKVDEMVGRANGAFSFRDASRFTGHRPGNHAFEEYRRSELKRMDEERRRLDDEARAFSDFVDELKRAKDREEFDAFMRKRRDPGTTSV